VEGAPPLANAVSEVEGGVVIDISVSPGAKRSGLTGYDPWRQRLQMAVAAAPVKGAANAEVVKVLGAEFGCRAAIVGGQTSRQKRVALDGLCAADVIGHLEKSLGQQSRLTDFEGADA